MQIHFILNFNTTIHWRIIFYYLWMYITNLSRYEITKEFTEQFLIYSVTFYSFNFMFIVLLRLELGMKRNEMSHMESKFN